MANFGKYGNLRIGEAKYASITPHHQIFDEDGDRLPGGSACYVNTFDGAWEDLCWRIFEERDETATAEACVVWRGRDGEDGQDFLVRSVGGVTDEVPIPAECVERFLPDIIEEEERPDFWDVDEDGEWNPELKSTDFTTALRGSNRRTRR